MMITTSMITTNMTIIITNIIIIRISRASLTAEWNGILMAFRIPIKKKVRSVDLTSQGTRQRSMQNVSLNGTEKMNKVH